MNKLICFAIFSIAYTVCLAQEPSKLPKFGEIDASTLQMKECSYDKTAGAVVLFDNAESFFDVNFYNAQVPVMQQTTHHTRIKILNKKEFDRANIKIKYRNDPSISIKNLEAQTYNVDASGNMIISKVDKASVYKKEINKYWTQKIFAFPDVKEGSIIEYKYTLEGATEGTWYFQKTIPVLFSRFIINFPVELNVAAIPYISLPVVKESDKRLKGSYSWYTMQNVPAFIEEPYMSCAEDYLQRIDLQLQGFTPPGQGYINMQTSWPKIIQALVKDEDFGMQLKKDIPRTADLDALLLGVLEPTKKMKIIHEYVRTNMKWNERDNIWALNGVKSAWKDKIGTSGEINLILINLLKDANLKTKPILVSTRDMGAVNTGLADYEQFNKVLAYVEIDSNVYVLDATERETPSHIIPLSVMDSEGLLIGKLDKYEWGWHTIWNPKNQFTKNVLINAEIANNKLTGSANVISNGYERIQDIQSLKKGLDNLKQSIIGGATVNIDSLDVGNEKDDSQALLQSFVFNAPVNSSGNYNYFSVNYFMGLNKNPFTIENRTTDIFYGALQDYSLMAEVSIPDNIVLEELPKSIKMVTPDNGILFQRFCEFKDGLLSVQIKVKFNNPLYMKEDYPDFKEFYKKMFELLNEKFVYKKK